MSTWIIGIHDEWMHHPTAVVESNVPPTLIDPRHDWAIELDEDSRAYMDEHGIGPVEYITDLAYSGDICHETGKHEPYMDGSPRDTYADENVLRIWAEKCEAEEGKQ